MNINIQTRSEGELSKRLKSYEMLTEFQNELLEHLYDDYGVIFEIVSKYLDCTYGLAMVCDAKGTVRSIFFDAASKETKESQQMLDEISSDIFARCKEEKVRSQDVPESLYQYIGQEKSRDCARITTLYGEVNQRIFSVNLFQRENDALELPNTMKRLMINSLKMCIENRIYHELVSFEGQHDQLTKLYNRRSYFKRSKEEYSLLASVGFLYFDVNNLKQVNDCYGHDAGDALLQKAAESFRPLTSETIHAYRMGGDEFIVIMMNCTKDDMRQFRVEWEDNLKQLNEKYGGTPCSIAVGTAFAKGSFEIDELCKIADKRMYKDKMRKKVK